MRHLSGRSIFQQHCHGKRAVVGFLPHKAVHQKADLLREVVMSRNRFAIMLVIFFMTILLQGCGGSSSGTSESPSSDSSANPVPSASFTFLPSAPSVNQSVQFSDTSTGNPTAWSWNFGDGGTSTAQNPIHVYLSAGTYKVTLKASNASGEDSVSHNVTVTAAVIAPTPTASFSFNPAAPVAVQSVSFTDTSIGSPTSWLWTFGDGATSSLQNPSHTFSSSGTFTVTLKAINSSGSSTVSRTVTVNPASSFALFSGNIILGSPTSTSIKAKVSSSDKSGTVYISYGTAPGTYDRQTSAISLPVSTPTEINLDGLQENTQYYYRVNFKATGESSVAMSDEHKFHTARSSGNTFTFTIQADSHLDENSDLDLYRLTHANVLADSPDFHIDLGDTFMCEKHSEPLSATVKAVPDQATVDARYAYDQSNLARMAHSVPLFLVNGNHEGELGWLANGTADNITVWSTLARQKYFLNPLPGAFYGGDSTDEAFVGKRASWYSWNWGNALFIVLDPYWNSKEQASRDAWNITLGDRQYEWLKNTLSSSTAKFKFVFIHNLTGGLDGQMRGGIEAAPFFEWGGKNQDGTNGFALKRPGWSMPVHNLLVQNGVTAVFHGHDHLYAKQELDGVVYQEVPQPSAKNFSNGSTLATEYHYAAGTILSSSGHLRVTVGSDGVTSQYVRAWLPRNENAQRINGQVDDTWTVGTSSQTTPSAPTAAFTSSTAAPATNQAVQFRDSSTGTPTSWLWSFGDGATSSLQNPSHSYPSSGSFTVTLTASNSSGSNSVNHSITVSQAGSSSSFNGNIVLGSPTATSINANIFSPDQSGTVYLAYGTASGSYDRQTSETSIQAATPLELSLAGLQGDTQYYYRLYFKATGETGFGATDEYTFQTARTSGKTFTFCIQGDSHPERARNQFNSELYTRTLQTAAADKPDFYMTIGDDFSVDTLDPATINAAKITERYTIQRPYLGLVGRSAPIFLVNGNHEQAARYLLDGTPNNVAVWAQNARNSYYSQPAPDGFYTGNTEQVPYIGLLRNHFAWTWGDALFVVIDPYWGSTICVDEPFGGGEKRTNIWDITHGDAQYQWLKTTLEQSQAKYKFVFAHHVMGTGRGGIELAGKYERGGYNNNGTTWGFTSNRPTWASPIHQLMEANHVTIFFQGHDHIWARQQLGSVMYQTLSEPADPNYTLYNSDAFLSGDKYPNTGYTRVLVAPTGVKVDYVRTYLPADEGAGRISGSTAFSYSIQ